MVSLMTLTFLLGLVLLGSKLLGAPLLFCTPFAAQSSPWKSQGFANSLQKLN